MSLLSVVGDVEPQAYGVEFKALYGARSNGTYVSTVALSLLGRLPSFLPPFPSPKRDLAYYEATEPGSAKQAPVGWRRRGIFDTARSTEYN
jgi:hypothetical protein